jgi:hypothetical protein
MPEAMIRAVRAAMGEAIFTSVLLFPGGLKGRPSGCSCFAIH